MARLVESRQSADAAPQGAAVASDIAIMAPDTEVEIAGESLLVREYRFFDGLKLAAKHRAFIDALAALLSSPSTFDDILAVLVEHEASTQEMVAASAGVSVEWLKQLREHDGDQLMLVWWEVNSGFFIRRAMRKAVQARLAAGSPSDGGASTTTSSPGATSEASTSSDG